MRSKERNEKLTVSLDLYLRLLHLFKEFRVAYDAGCIPHLAARFIQTCNDSHYCPLCDICQVSDLLEGL